MISRGFHYTKISRIRNPYPAKKGAEKARNQKILPRMYKPFHPGDTFNIQKKVLLILPFLMREARTPAVAMLLSFFVIHPYNTRRIQP